MAYLIRFDLDSRSQETIQRIETVYDGEAVSTDLMDLLNGRFVTTNFHLGNCTSYSYGPGGIQHRRDLPTGLTGTVHGVKFFTDEVIAVTFSHPFTRAAPKSRLARAVRKGRRSLFGVPGDKQRGVHFFETETMRHLFHIPSENKGQDVQFLSPNRLVMIGVAGRPRHQAHECYPSEMELVEFDLADGESRLLHSVRFENTHLDCAAFDGDAIYVTDQSNDSVLVVTPDLEPKSRIEGFSFPHGIDIAHGLMAVTNYGTNSIDVAPTGQFLASAQIAAL